MNERVDWREWLAYLSAGWIGLEGENTLLARAVLEHIESLNRDIEHQSARRKYWRDRAEKADAELADTWKDICVLLDQHVSAEVNKEARVRLIERFQMIYGADAPHGTEGGDLGDT